MQEVTNRLEKPLSTILKNLSEEASKNLSDLIKNKTETTPEKFYEARPFTSQELERTTTHQNRIVVQYASAFEAKKAIYMARLESSLQLESILLNDLELYHIDQDLKTEKLKKISQNRNVGEDREKELTERLKKDLGHLRRRQYLNKFIDSGSDYKEKNTTVARYDTAQNIKELEINSEGPAQRISAISRNRIRERDEIRSELQGMLQELGGIHINNENEFSFNLAGLETVPSKMAERGRKLRGFGSDAQPDKIDFQEELKLLRARRENYLFDMENSNQNPNERLRKSMREAQTRLTKYDYEDVRAEIDNVLAEYGLDESQRTAFEEMMVLNKDLASLLDGTHRGAYGAFDELLKESENLTKDTIPEISKNQKTFMEDRMEKGDRLLRRVGRSYSKSNYNRKLANDHPKNNLLKDGVRRLFSVASRSNLKLRRLDDDRRLQKNMRQELRDRIRDDRLRELRDNDSKRAERHQILFERELEMIYQGEMLNSIPIQEHITLTTKNEQRNPFDRLNSLSHILDLEDKRFITQEDEDEIIEDIYGEDNMIYKRRDIIREEERARIQKEQNFNTAYSASKLKSRVRDYELQEGVLQDMFKIKPEVAVSHQQIDELVEGLNYSDSNNRYVWRSDDAGEFFILGYSSSFRFNVPKYLRFKAEREAAAKIVCEREGLDFQDFKRVEKNMPCASPKNEDEIRSKVLGNEQFQEAEASFIDEYFSPKEWNSICSLTDDIIENQIRNYKEHLAFGKYFKKNESDDLVLVKSERKLRTELSGELPRLPVDLIID